MCCHILIVISILDNFIKSNVQIFLSFVKSIGICYKKDNNINEIIIEFVYFDINIATSLNSKRVHIYY